MTATATAAEVPALFDPAACAAATNHGAYVSFVAHATAGLPDHGALVSAAAQSDCGKVAPTATAPTTEAAPAAGPDHDPRQEGSEEGEGRGGAATHGKSGLHRTAVHGKSGGKGKHSH